MQNDIKGYAPEQDDLQLLQALMKNDSIARASASLWLDGVDLKNLNEGLRRLLPLLNHRMTEWSLDHPKLPEVEREYRRYWIEAQRMQFQTEGMLTILALLDTPIVLLKGAALSRTVYPAPALRPFADIDILFHPKFFKVGVERLVSFGFRVDGGSPHSLLLRREGYPEIDFHRSPYHEAFAEHLVTPLFSRIVPLESKKVEVYRLGDEDQLLHTIAHGLRSNSVSPLRWIVDAGLLLEHTHLTLDWDLFCQEAIRLDLVEVAARGLRQLSLVFPEKIDDGAFSFLEGRRTAYSRLWFSAEREWQGPSAVLGTARRNRSWTGSMIMLFDHYNAVAARQGVGSLARKALSRTGKIITGSIKK